MQVKRIGWLGTRTARFDETEDFFADVMGLAPIHSEPNFAMFGLPSGSRDYVEVFGSAKGDSGFEAEHYTTGPVPGFLVEGLDEARAELAAAGIELLGDVTWARSRPGYGWFHFRGPDGNVYAMLQGSPGIDPT